MSEIGGIGLLESDFNPYCNPKEWEQFNFHKWGGWPRIWDSPFEWFWGWRRWEYKPAEQYKDEYIIHHRDRIKQIAAQHHIPADLLAGVARSEATGEPDNAKWAILYGRQMFGETMRRHHLDDFAEKADSTKIVRLFLGKPDKTSFGITAMQLSVAAQMADPFSKMQNRPPQLTPGQQDHIAACLMMDVFDLNVVARYLHDLILYDYPDADTMHLDDTEWIIVGSRYNRGIERSKADLLRSLDTPATEDRSDPNWGIRDWTSYGRALLEHRSHVRHLLNN